jgi:hypothetical protein
MMFASFTRNFPVVFVMMFATGLRIAPDAKGAKRPGAAVVAPDDSKEA